MRELGDDAPERDRSCIAAGRDLDPPPGFSVPYALQTLVDELTMAPVVLRDGAPVEIEPLTRRRRGRVRRADRRAAGRSTRSTPSCARSATASAAARRASGSPVAGRCSSELRELIARARGGGRRRGSRGRRRPPRSTVSVHMVEAAAGGRPVAGSRGHRADGGVGARRRDRLDRRAGGRRGAAARARGDRRPRRAAARALHRARTTCSPSSSGAAVGSRSRARAGGAGVKVGVADRDQGRRVPGRADAGRARGSSPSTATRC